MKLRSSRLAFSVLAALFIAPQSSQIPFGNLTGTAPRAFEPAEIVLPSDATMPGTLAAQTAESDAVASRVVGVAVQATDDVLAV